MRKVIGNLKDLGLTAFDTIDITFELVNKLGKSVSLQNEQQYFSVKSTFTTTTDTYGNFTIELLENGNINRTTFYKVTIADTDSFLIDVPKGDTDVNILCLVNQIDYDGIVTITETITGDVFVFDEKFIKKMNSFFNGEKPYLTRAEEKMIDKYTYIANISKEKRCSDVDKLDKYLSTIGAK